MDFIYQFIQGLPSEKRSYGCMVCQKPVCGARIGAIELSGGNDLGLVTYFFFHRKDVTANPSHELCIGLGDPQVVIVEGIAYDNFRRDNKRYVMPVNSSFNDDKSWNEKQAHVFSVFDALIEVGLRREILRMEETHPQNPWNGFSFNREQIASIEDVASCSIKQLIVSSLTM